MPINAQIKADLLTISGVEKTFELLNIYKGVPLVYKATLNQIGDHTIQMSVEPPWSICLKWEPSTIMLYDKNSLAIKARVVSFDVKTGNVELGDLQYADRGFGVRAMVRVEPGEPIAVKISCEDQSSVGEMLDVSLTGLGIRIKTLGDPPFQTHDTVDIVMNLMGKTLHPTGTILSIREVHGDYRLAVQFVSEITVPVEIARYVTHRRADIHRELRETYDAAIQDAAA
jgi:hypothetical protein